MGFPASPPWPDVSRAPRALAVTWTLYVLAIVVYGLRMYTRIRPLRSVLSIRWDDIAITVAFLALTVQMILLVVRVKNGFGRHNDYVPVANKKIAARLLIISQHVWFLGLTMCKISVSILLLRLKQEKGWKISLYAMLFLLVASITTTYVLSFIQCRPTAALWDPTIPGAKCWAPKYLQAKFLATNIFIIVTDVIFSLLPVTFIRQLTRPLREKIVLYFLMGLALFGSAASILKTIQMNNFTNVKDSLWAGVDITMWCYLEQEIAIIAASLPYLKSTFERALNRSGLLASPHINTPSCVAGNGDHSTCEMKGSESKWYRCTKQKTLGDRKIKEHLPSELISEGSPKMPKRTIRRGINSQDSWDIEKSPGIAA